jgi:hypothetical protein
MLIDMKIIVLYAIVSFVLYLNWTDMGQDNEKQALDKIQNSQGLLVKATQ